MFHRLIALCGYELTLEQLLQVAKPYAPELGYNLGEVSQTLIERAFQLALRNPSFCPDENGVIKLLKVTDNKGATQSRKRQTVVIKKRLIETDEEVQAAVLETIKDAGVFTEDLPEHILDNDGSASWVFGPDVEDDDILTKVARALEELEHTGKIEMDVEEAGWRIAA